MIIGQEPCIGKLRRGVYVGPNQILKGTTALIKDSTTPGYVGVQFDTVQKYMYGWHSFRATDFEFDKEVDDEIT